jgi:hypothetical protein
VEERESEIRKSSRDSHEIELLGSSSFRETLPIHLRRTAIEVIVSTVGGAVDEPREGCLSKCSRPAKYVESNVK